VAAQGIRVPFVDLRPVNLPLRDEILARFATLLERGNFGGGSEVESFEAGFAAYCAAARCVGMSSGLDALRLGLLASGLEPGDEVIVPANTFVATFEAVVQAGGAPVAVDVSETDYNLDVEAAAAAVTERTTFLLPVHLYGQMADMHAIRQLAERHGLRVLEDACQAHGAERDGLRAGACGTAAAFSFYPAKNLGAAGDAGALVTDDDAIADLALALRQHGEEEKYRSRWPGYTARLDSIQAIVLGCKLPLLDSWNAERTQAAAFYDGRLAGVGDLRLPPRPPGSTPVWHLYVVRTAQREELAAHLAAEGIATGRHYPEPPHLSEAFGRLAGGAGSFPVTEALAEELLSLPLFPGIEREQLEAVVGAIRAFFGDV
jgi:dTDP-3-amino-3,4,6-trideoxy-alpha-D-glucose transaminase